MIISVVRRAGFVAFTTFTVLQAQAKTWVIPHVFETKGGTGSQAFDSLLEFTYNQSFNGKDTGSATAQVYVYDEATGQPMVGAGGLAVCNPCQAQLNAQTRKHRIVLDDMIAAAGGYEQGISSKSGFAIVTVTGPNEDAVNLQALMVNHHATNDDRGILDLGARIVPQSFAPQDLRIAAHSRVERARQ
jgi:hypothetical protein